MSTQRQRKKERDSLLAYHMPSPRPPGHLEHWSGWTRIHRARARWFHQRTRLERDREITLNALVI
jgi:hypothetical protein